MGADFAVVFQVLDELLHLFHVVVSTGFKGLTEDERPQRHAGVVDPQLQVDAAEEQRCEADKGAADLCLHDHWPQGLCEALDLRLMLRSFPAFRPLRPSRVVLCKKLTRHRVEFNARLVNASDAAQQSCARAARCSRAITNCTLTSARSDPTQPPAVLVRRARAIYRFEKLESWSEP
jgi:hypothetical protein